MTDKEKLNKGRKLFNNGKYKEAREMFESITTKDLSIRLNTILALLSVLDPVSENDKLLNNVNEGLKIAKKTNNTQIISFLLGKKSLFLSYKLSKIIYRQKNLKLSSRVFDWIGFSLEKDKKEYEEIEQKRKKLEEEIESILSKTIEATEKSKVNEFKGHQFATIGDVYSSKFLIYKLDFQESGKIKSKIANMYFIRRWNLDRYLYNKDARKKIDESCNRCIKYFEKAIEEFRIAGKSSEQAHTVYNLATKMFLLFNRFSHAKKLLDKARFLASSTKEKGLLNRISQFEQEITNKNKKSRDYVREMGLDMPNGRHPFL